MYDFNFFEPYLTKGRQPSASTFHCGPLVILLLVILAAWPLFNFGYGIQLKREMAALETEVTNDEKYPCLEEADAEKRYIAQLQGQLASLSSMDITLMNGEWLNEPFLFSLLSTAPNDVEMEELAVRPDKRVEIGGIASGKPAIAELAHNLRDTDRFDSLYVESISNEDGTYGFTMEFELRGVGADAAD